MISLIILLFVGCLFGFAGVLEVTLTEFDKEVLKLVTFKLGNLLVGFGCTFSAESGFLEGSEAFGAHLGDDLRKHLGDLLHLRGTRDGESVCVGAGLNLRHSFRNPIW